MQVDEGPPSPKIASKVEVVKKESTSLQSRRSSKIISPATTNWGQFTIPTYPPTPTSTMGIITVTIKNERATPPQIEPQKKPQSIVKKLKEVAKTSKESKKSPGTKMQKKRSHSKSRSRSRSVSAGRTKTPKKKEKKSRRSIRNDEPSPSVTTAKTKDEKKEKKEEKKKDRRDSESESNLGLFPFPQERLLLEVLEETREHRRWKKQDHGNWLLISHLPADS